MGVWFLSTTPCGFREDLDQEADASRTLSGRATPVALKTGPMELVAGVRRTICCPRLLMVTSCSRSRSRRRSAHSTRLPARRSFSSSAWCRISARNEQKTWPLDHLVGGFVSISVESRRKQILSRAVSIINCSHDGSVSYR